MDEVVRDRRIAELRSLQSCDPLELIAKYCEIAGQPASNQLPHGVSFNRMIETIVDAEMASEKSPVATE